MESSKSKNGNNIPASCLCIGCGNKLLHEDKRYITSSCPHCKMVIPGKDNYEKWRQYSIIAHQMSFSQKIETDSVILPGNKIQILIIDHRSHNAKATIENVLDELMELLDEDQLRLGTYNTIMLGNESQHEGAWTQASVTISGSRSGGTPEIICLACGHKEFAKTESGSLACSSCFNNTIISTFYRTAADKRWWFDSETTAERYAGYEQFIMEVVHHVKTREPSMPMEKLFSFPLSTYFLREMEPEVAAEIILEVEKRYEVISDPDDITMTKLSNDGWRLETGWSGDEKHYFFNKVLRRKDMNGDNVLGQIKIEFKEFMEIVKKPKVYVVIDDKQIEAAQVTSMSALNQLYWHLNDFRIELNTYHS